MDMRLRAAYKSAYPPSSSLFVGKSFIQIQKQPLEVFCKTGVFKNFPNFTRKFCELFKNTGFTEHFRTTDSPNLIFLDRRTYLPRLHTGL